MTGEPTTTPTPDATLLRLCAEHDAVWRCLETHPATEPTSSNPEIEADQQCLIAARFRLFQRLILTPAQTDAGRQAKARTLRLVREDIAPPRMTDADAAAWSLLHDVLGEKPAWNVTAPPAQPMPEPHPATVPANPDARFLALYEEAERLDKEADAILDAVDDLPVGDPVEKAARVKAQPLLAKFHVVVGDVVDVPVHTQEGMKAKARLVLSYLRNDANHSDIALSLARDVLRLAPGAA